MICRQRHELLTSAKQKRIPANEKRVGPLPPSVAKAASISRLVLAFTTLICTPSERAAARTSRTSASVGDGEVDKIGLICPIAKQAFVGRLLSDLWFQRLSGFPLRSLSVRDFFSAGDDVLLARGGALSFCSRRVRLLRHQIATAVLSRCSVLYLAATAFHLAKGRPT